MRRRILLNQLIPFLAGVVLTVFLEMISNELIGSGPWVRRFFVAIGLVLLGGALIYNLRPRRVRVNMGMPHIVRRPEEATAYARRGLVTFVSLYRPFKSISARGLTDEQKREAAARRDYTVLDLENSNLEPLIRSVMTHAPRLQHCWLIATSSLSPEHPGSDLFVPVLVRYLQEVKGVQCQFHYGPEWTIPLEDDVVLAQKTWEHILKSFGEAEKRGVTPAEMIADITSGFRAMTLGMILACLDGDRDIQLMGTRYDQQGNPESSLFPIRFPFEIQWAEKE